MAKLESVSSDDGASGEWRCSRCGAVCGVWIDGGVLDLEALRTSGGNPSSDFVVYTGNAT